MSELLDVFRAEGALLEGHFLLSSGLHSPALPAVRPRADGPGAGHAPGRGSWRAALRPLLREPLRGAVVAPALGGVLVAHEVARALGCRALFTERQDGAMTLRRGFTLEPGERWWWWRTSSRPAARRAR